MRTSPWSRSRSCAAMVLAASILPWATASVGAQTYWRVPASVGGALAGTGVGWMVDVAVWSQRQHSVFEGPSLSVTPVGMVAGGIAGFVVGLGADHRLAAGDTLSRRMRGTLRVTTFLTPVAIGAATAFAIINPPEEWTCVPYTGPDPNIYCTSQPPAPKLMKDETVALLTIGGGIVTGYVLQRVTKKSLWPRARIGLLPSRNGLAITVGLGTM